MVKTIEERKNDFLKKSFEKHGTKYNYSKVEYINSRTRIIITCSVHGDFEQTPADHLKGGCKKCSVKKNLGTENFINICNDKHNYRYDYSKVDYKGANGKVCIICLIHGEFHQVAQSHIFGYGCAKCSGVGKLTTEDFIKKSKETHGDKYDYSKVEYINSKNKVILICPEHGEFKISPNPHINQKHGCRECGIIESTKTTNQFIKDAKIKYGNKYDYSKVEYIHCNKPIIIICPKHGEFIDTPGGHLRKNNYCGCKKCTPVIMNNIFNENFIIKSNEMHNFKYNYSKSIYKSATTKLIITCPIHGDFEQSPMCHMRKSGGCHKCKPKYIDTEIFVTRANIVHENRYTYENTIYVNARTKVCITCPIHGDFFQMPCDHLRKYGCAECSNETNQSELKLLKYITNNLTTTEVIHQYKTKWLKLQSIDIFIPEYNIGIEYQGGQHFEPVEYFGGECRFIQDSKRDIRKYDLCLKNNVKLFYFTYDEKCKTIDYLSEIFVDEEKLKNEIYKIIDNGKLIENT